MTSIIPVLLAGGVGSRLWPLSRKSYPKQFSPLSGEKSLFQASAKRLSGPGFQSPLILTGADFRFIVTEQLLDIDLSAGDVLVEPIGRNTAPAVLVAALWLEAHQKNGLMLVAPSDHLIPDSDHFRLAVQAGIAEAQAGQLVTFGITPDRAETGYGYIELSAIPKENTPVEVARFIEKPGPEQAQEMLEAGNFLWNAGIFLFSTHTILEAFRTHAPDLIAPVSAALTGTEKDLDFYRLDPSAWQDVANISIDHAIMEKASNLSVIPYSGHWSDLGDWDAVGREMARDASGNAISGAVTVLDCKRSLLRAEDSRVEVVGIGLENMLVVATEDAVLVANRTHSQEVKEAVTALKEKSAAQAEVFSWDHRPWGRFETLALGSRFQVKRIVVKPGGILSLQSHVHRAEHWIVVEGTAKVTIDRNVQLVSENQSVYVPLGASHRVENPGKVPMVLIEVQTGTYLGEDDITRYEDVYDRKQGAKG